MSRISPPRNCQFDRALEQPAEGTAEYQFRGNTLKEWGAILQDVLYAFDQRYLYGTVPQYKKYGSRSQGLKAEVSLALTITSNDP